ncbi:MAG: hypothetical protein Q9M35_06240 [Rhodothermus sp.]|nr:hypothetical protein [Rhodothermus sp.]
MSIGRIRLQRFLGEDRVQPDGRRGRYGRGVNRIDTLLGQFDWERGVLSV